MVREKERRVSVGRRNSDKEVYAMSEKALNEAMTAKDQATAAKEEVRVTTEKMNTHLAVCEAQNMDILRRLGNQDKMLYGIMAGIGLEVLHLIGGKLFG